jgi:hypothetical protein
MRFFAIELTLKQNKINKLAKLKKKFVQKHKNSSLKNILLMKSFEDLSKFVIKKENYPKCSSVQKLIFAK